MKRDVLEYSERLFDILFLFFVLPLMFFGGLIGSIFYVLKSGFVSGIDFVSEKASTYTRKHD